jgi:glutamate racemase
MRIGVFDSGLGGLAVLEAIRTRLPRYDYIYYADTAHLPYGDKNEEEIYELTRRSVGELFCHGCMLVILACNTASAESLKRLQETLLVGAWSRRRILGVIIPTIEELVDGMHTEVLLIGTRRTIESRKYEQELSKRRIDTVHITSVPTPELVPLIEAGRCEEACACIDDLIHKRGKGHTTLVLGCTHYILLKDALRLRHQKLRIIAQDELIPSSLENYLIRHKEIDSVLTQKGSLISILTHERVG